MGPAEHLDDGTLLSSVVFTALSNSWGLPKEVERLHGDRELCTIRVGSLDDKRKGIVQRTISREFALRRKTLTSPVVLELLNARVLSTDCLDLG